VHKFVVSQCYGYSVVNLNTPGSPSVAGHHNMVTQGGGGPFTVHGDGQSTVGAIYLSKDCTRMIVGWNDSTSGTVVLTDSGSIFEVRDTISNLPRPLNVTILKRPDGKYVAFGRGFNFFYAADISDSSLTAGNGNAIPPPDINGTLASYQITVPELPNTPSRLMSDGKYVLTNDTVRTLILLDASGAYGSPDITENFTQRVLTLTDFGIATPTDYVINDFTMVADPFDAGHVWIFVSLLSSTTLAPVDIVVAEILDNGTIDHTYQVSPPESFFGSGTAPLGTAFSYMSGSNPRAWFLRDTALSYGFVNITVDTTENTAASNVVTVSHSDCNFINWCGFEEAGSTYIYVTTGNNPRMYVFS